MVVEVEEEEEEEEGVWRGFPAASEGCIGGCCRGGLSGVEVWTQ